MITITPIPAFNDNYIWLLQRGDERWVVDPGDDEPVIEALDGAALTGILITHHHYDHTGGMQSLIQRYRCPAFGPGTIEGITRPLADGDEFELLGTTAKVRAVPGHTLDHIAICLESGGQHHLFCGDTLFAAGCGRLFEGTPEQMYRSLQSLSDLPEDTRVYCAHEYTVSNLKFALAAEPDNDKVRDRMARAQEQRQLGRPTLPSTIGEERDTNPFLRCDSPAIRQKVRDHGANEQSDSVEIFAILRQWKDTF